MKNKFLSSALLLMACCALWTGCNKSDDDTTEQEVVTSVTYEVPNRYDLMDIADITVYYTDGYGTEQSEKMTTNTWKKTLTTPKLRIYSLRVVTKRNDTELTQDVYTLGGGALITVETSKGGLHGTGSSSQVMIRKDNVDKYILQNTEDSTILNLDK